jgi:PAS domain S-box-containing protein
MAPPLDIIIIEDDEDAQNSLRDVLKLDDHRVATFASAAQAIKAHGHRPCDIIICDRQLPDGLAEKLLARLRKAFPHADVIVVTGFADLQATISALREGASDYIIKPINPVALRGSILRIGERRRIENELYKERHFAEQILQTADAIILVLDTDGKIVRLNPFLSSLTGYEAAEIVGRDWFEMFIPERERERLRNVFERTVSQLPTHGVVNPIVKKNGEECEIRWSNTTLKDDDGHVFAVLAVGLDVSDLTNAQRKLVQSERLAAIGQTMTGMAHESRNALQRMQNALELLEDEFQDDPRVLRDLAKIGRASNDLRNLLEEVRSYASPIKLERSRTTLMPVWRRAWQHLDATRLRRHVRLVDEVDGDVPPVNIDARRFEQVFRNLFENALDACPDPLRITICQEAKDGGTRLTITDSGPGFCRESRDRAFDAFYTTKAKGTGLGLSIVRRIVEAHGGSIRLADTNGGAQIEIDIPG